MNNNYIFIDGKHYKRVNKTKARNLYNAGTELLIYPINAQPDGFWDMKQFIKSYDDDDIMEFDKTINRFEHYNCNSELGRYTKFYIMIQDNGRA